MEKQSILEETQKNTLSFIEGFNQRHEYTSQQMPCKILSYSWISTPLGTMLAIADPTGIYLLEFIDQEDIEKEVMLLKKKTSATLVKRDTAILQQAKKELEEYFSGKRYYFTLPLILWGTIFQKHAWDTLLQIAYATTKSYLQQAIAMGNPKGCRAVANANGANRLAIVVPCHRIIHHDGSLGGYNGGVCRKQWLLDHEKRHQGTSSSLSSS